MSSPGWHTASRPILQRPSNSAAALQEECRRDGKGSVTVGFSRARPWRVWCSSGRADAEPASARWPGGRAAPPAARRRGGSGGLDDAVVARMRTATGEARATGRLTVDASHEPIGGAGQPDERPGQVCRLTVRRCGPPEMAGLSGADGLTDRPGVRGCARRTPTDPRHRSGLNGSPGRGDRASPRPSEITAILFASAQPFCDARRYCLSGRVTRRRCGHQPPSTRSATASGSPFRPTTTSSARPVGSSASRNPGRVASPRVRRAFCVSFSGWNEDERRALDVERQRQPVG